MKLNSKAYVIIVIIISILTFIGFRVYQFMLSPPPKDYNHLNIGDVAPNFDGKFICEKDNNKEEIKLSNELEKNKLGVILYFYPKDGTKYCTLEAQSFVRNYPKLKAMGYEVIGVSSDNAKSHVKFIKDFKIPYKLICDPKYKIHEKYGACSKKPFLGRRTYRMTFVINKSGKIDQIITKVNSHTHATQIIENYKKMK